MTQQHDLADLLHTGTQALQLELLPAQSERLLAYLRLLAKWNATYNLTAIRDPAQMVIQHLLDSLAAVPLLASARRVLDVGAGGGLPGMVLAIWAMDSAPGMQISLIDTVHKKTAFLTQAKAELGLTNVSVHTGKVQELDVAEKYDLITSRAFASLADFIGWSSHLLEEGGQFAALKGVIPHDEILALPSGWTVQAIHPLHVPHLAAQRHVLLIGGEQANSSALA